MSDLYPRFDMPDIVGATENTVVAFPKSWLWDWDICDFVQTGSGDVVEVDGLTAWAQWCVKAILTQRLAFVVYDWNYGADIESCLRQPTRAVTEAELEREITEALLTDPRTAEVKNFRFEWSGDELTVWFTVVNALGQPAEVQVGVGYREVQRQFSLSRVEQYVSDWLRGELVNVEPTEDGKLVIKTVAQPTFTRSSIAYKSDGSQVAANQPRFDVIDGVLGLMVEEGTTNLANNPTFSGDVGTTPSGWDRDVTIQQDDFFGQLINVAELLCVSGNNYEDFGTDIAYPLAYNTTYTISFWARGTMELTYELETTRGIASATWKSKPPMSLQWQRYEVTIVTASSGPIFPFWWHLQNVNDVNVDKWVRIARIQLEQKPYATSFIDGTRSPETLTIPTASVLNPQEGTIEFWVKPLVVVDWNNFFRMYTSNGRFLLFFGTNGIAKFDYGPYNTGPQTPAGTIEANNWYYIALRWSATTGKQALFVNGVKYEQDLPNGVATMFPATVSIVNDYSAYIDDLRISNRARTDAEILSAYQSGQPAPVDANTILKADFDGNLDAQSGIIP